MPVHPLAPHAVTPPLSKEGGQPSITMCGEELPSSHYSGQHPPEILITADEPLAYDEHRYVEPTSPKGYKQRSLRIPCRNVLACVKTQSASIVVKMSNVSQNGFCFRSSEKFWPGTAVYVATYYIEGGQNIFQDGKIVRVRHSPSGIVTEYGVEFR